MPHKHKAPHHKKQPVEPPPPANNQPRPTSGPVFAQGTPTPDPKHFKVKHKSDEAAYKILDSEKQSPRPFPVVDTEEPLLQFADVFGDSGAEIVAEIEKSAQIVFHAVGDTGNVKGPPAIKMKSPIKWWPISPTRTPATFLRSFFTSATSSTASARACITTISSMMLIAIIRRPS